MTEDADSRAVEGPRTPDPTRTLTEGSPQGCEPLQGTQHVWIETTTFADADRRFVCACGDQRGEPRCEVAE